MTGRVPSPAAPGAACTGPAATLVGVAKKRLGEMKAIQGKCPNCKCEMLVVGGDPGIILCDNAECSRPGLLAGIIGFLGHTPQIFTPRITAMDRRNQWTVRDLAGNAIHCESLMTANSRCRELEAAANHVKAFLAALSIPFEVVDTPTR